MRSPEANDAPMMCPSNVMTAITPSWQQPPRSRPRRLRTRWRSTEQALEAVFARWARRERAPGIAWGLVRDGALVAGGGLGSFRAAKKPLPSVDSVFRIASMTKSFTGAALMTLVADGRLRLDDPVADHVPELAAWRGPTADGPALTVRHLVSMEAGLPTDDPWADRHIDLPDEEMDALIAAGATFAWTPGTSFEYSNLGWGLVGRVIERVSGKRPQELVSSALLEPLGMASTTWVRPPGSDVAEPYRVRDEGWLHEGEPLGDGSIAPMGGIWSTVRDLARWVAFFIDAFPPRDEAEDGPLPRWARREMQQLRRVDELSRFRPSPGGPSRASVTGYGIGLAVRVDERLGVSVGHSGGFPGYGSHMRWLPEHGVGVIGLSNVTYGRMAAACLDALDVLADRDELGPARGVRASPALVDASARAASLLSSWRDADADDLLADNVGPDEPYERRAAEAAIARRPPWHAPGRVARGRDADAGLVLDRRRRREGRDRAQPRAARAVARCGGPSTAVRRADRRRRALAGACCRRRVRRRAPGG